MKGPGLRITHDVRRLFVCAKCGRKLKLPGHVVARQCGCESGGVWMTMSEPKPIVRHVAKPTPEAVPSAEPAESQEEPLAEQPAMEAAPEPVEASPPVEAASVEAPPSDSPKADSPPASVEQDSHPTAPESPQASDSSPPASGKKRTRKKRNRKRRRKGKGGGGDATPGGQG